MTDESIESIDKYGNKIWKNEQGQLHRLDGPAVIRTDGTQEWYVNGKIHRIDGPAIIRKNGSQYWYINDKCHRIDGPAYIGKDGTQEWWIHDINITDEVNKWMKCNDVSYPFNEIALMQFKLRFL
jgi:hypothetical protein